METDDTNPDKIPVADCDSTETLPQRDDCNHDEGMDAESSEPVIKRRVSLRPRKRSGTDIIAASQEYVHSPKQRCKNAKSHRPLETIFEEPVIKKNGQVVLVGMTKFKRYISFSQFVSKAKLKKRKEKLKKLKTLKKAEKKKHLYSPLQEVEGQLTRLDI